MKNQFLNSSKKVQLLITFLILIVANCYAEDLYVDQNVKGGLNNGASWSDAYLKITDAIASAEAGSTIHIAKGIYTGNVSSTAITIDKSLTIIGGYPTGGGTQNHFLNETILDGSKKRRVLNITKANTLKGIIVQNGKETDYDGAGIRIASTSTLEDCIIRNNVTSKSFGKDVFGGGIYSVFNLTLINCKIENNSVTNTSSEENEVKGGGLYVRGTLTATNCLFVNNTASSTAGNAFGAGLFVSKQANIINCLITKNSASSSTKAEGAGLYASGTKGSNSKAINLRNSILWKNTISTDKGASFSSGEYSVNGTSADHFSPVSSLIFGEKLSGYGNIKNKRNSFDPEFTDFENNDFTLKSSSELINAGNDKYNKIATDLAGKKRSVGSIDIGPYEIN